MTAENFSFGEIAKMSVAIKRVHGDFEHEVIEITASGFNDDEVRKSFDHALKKFKEMK